jgi:hypothetical protein
MLALVRFAFLHRSALGRKNNLKRVPPIQENNGKENNIILFQKIEQLVGAQTRDFF